MVVRFCNSYGGILAWFFVRVTSQLRSTILLVLEFMLSSHTGAKPFNFLLKGCLGVSLNVTILISILVEDIAQYLLLIVAC